MSCQWAVARGAVSARGMYRQLARGFHITIVESISGSFKYSYIDVWEAIEMP